MPRRLAKEWMTLSDLELIVQTRITPSTSRAISAVAEDFVFRWDSNAINYQRLQYDM